MANLQMLQQTADQFATDSGKYKKAVNQFNFDADVYNKQLKEYQGLVDAYNNNPAVLAYDAAVKNYNSNLLPAYQTQVDNYNKNLLPVYQSQVDAYNKKVNDWSSKVVRFTNGNLYQDATPAQMVDLINSGKIHPNSPNGQAFSSQLNQYRPGAAPTAPSVPTAPSTPTAPNVQKPGEFTAVKPELTATAPKDPGFTKVQMDALSGKQSVAQQERAKDSGLVSGAQAALQDARSEGSMIGGLLARARYST